MNQQRYNEAVDSLYHLCSNIEPGTYTRHSVTKFDRLHSQRLNRHLNASFRRHTTTAAFLSAVYFQDTIALNVLQVRWQWALQVGNLLTYLFYVRSHPNIATNCNWESKLHRMILYDTIRYDNVFNMQYCKKLTDSQLSLPHGTNKKCKRKN